VAGRDKDVHRILIVDDDPELVRLLTLWLGHCGYLTTSASNGLEALSHISRGDFDLVVLDVEMPTLDGLETCRRIRGQSSIPILMLTVLGDPDHRVDGLETGADDYLPKPFSIRELILRVQSLLRRVKRAPQIEDRGHFADDRLTIDVSRRLVLRDGIPVHLTRTEFAILSLLIAHRGQVIPAERILQEIWGQEISVTNARYVRVYIHHLRRKIEPDPSKPRYVLTEKHLGYSFSP